MNERIKELYRLSWEPSTAICPASNQPYESKCFSADLFAELIVHECATFLYENSGYDNSNYSWHPEPEDLLQHFGIKE
jgi:hypothetical protein